MLQTRPGVALSPSSSPQSSAFNLKDLKEFNSGLVYGFDAESSPKNYKADSVEHFLNASEQHQDMLEAYRYAEEKILPVTREKINSVTPEQLITMLNQIHQRIARKLAIEFKVSAGEFTTQQVIRWEQPNDISIITEMLYYYFSPTHAKGMDLLAEAKKLNYDPTVVNDFFTLLKLKKLDTDSSISLPADYKPSSNWKNEKAKQIIYKLIAIFHAGKLSKSELAIVEKIFKICPAPQAVPTLMQEFAEQLLVKWRDCKPDDVDAAATLAQFAFYNLTEIHPYFNGNGRLGTCLINIILRSLGHPSILLRYPQERDDPMSSYSRAIQNIYP